MKKDVFFSHHADITLHSLSNQLQSEFFYHPSTDTTLPWSHQRHPNYKSQAMADHFIFIETCYLGHYYLESILNY